MTHLAAAGDTIRITTRDVTLVDAMMVEQPVTSGLTGTVTLRNWATDAVVDGPVSIVLKAGDDWYVDVTAPANGRYRIVVVIQAGGAQRTLAGELKVDDPPT